MAKYVQKAIFWALLTREATARVATVIAYRTFARFEKQQTELF